MSFTRNNSKGMFNQVKSNLTKIKECAKQSVGMIEVVNGYFSKRYYASRNENCEFDSRIDFNCVYASCKTEEDSKEYNVMSYLLIEYILHLIFLAIQCYNKKILKLSTVNDNSGKHEESCTW